MCYVVLRKYQTWSYSKIFLYNYKVGLEQIEKVNLVDFKASFEVGLLRKFDENEVNEKFEAT